MTVVALRRTAPAPALPVPDAAARYRIAHAASFAGDPLVHLPDDIDDLAPYLPTMIEEAEQELSPVGAAEVLKCLAAFAARRDLPMPEDDLAIDLDVEILGDLPRDLCRRAFVEAWKSWPSHYRRLPDANAIMGYVKEELEARHARAGGLKTLAKKLVFREKLKRETEEMRAYSRRSDRHSLDRMKECLSDRRCVESASRPHV